ncbi:lytic transglycosylase domain-containing protein [Xanthomonas sp. GPE 39]|uniref:lytic transglycosylase domain-containing protein n=1 Tax=Xanthomonas sp. GPE 39 TaxID=1583099 RepID=UPI0009E524CF|nr:lytic transglycosylase domain-containing protein [Xanthomonas sp. GPE 39]
MLPGMELLSCPEMAVSAEVMQHVVRVESSRNPFAIGVVGGHLIRQPKNISEAVATAHMLEQKGYNFSLGLGQVNRYNLIKYGLDSYEKAFRTCPNLQVASKILAECYSRSGGNWGKSFSCYYSGNFETGYSHGYVQKIYASINQERSQTATPVVAIPVIPVGIRHAVTGTAKAAIVHEVDSIIARRIAASNNQLADGLIPEAQISTRNQAAVNTQGQEKSPASATALMPTQEKDADLYVIRSTGGGKGVAVPVGSGANSASESSASSSPVVAGSAVAGKAAPPPTSDDGAFVF